MHVYDSSYDDCVSGAALLKTFSMVIATSQKFYFLRLIIQKNMTQLFQYPISSLRILVNQRSKHGNRNCVRKIKAVYLLNAFQWNIDRRLPLLIVSSLLHVCVPGCVHACSQALHSTLMLMLTNSLMYCPAKCIHTNTPTYFH